MSASGSLAMRRNAVRVVSISMCAQSGRTVVATLRARPSAAAHRKGSAIEDRPDVDAPRHPRGGRKFDLVTDGTTGANY
jgi:hypothetical protein